MHKRNTTKRLQNSKPFILFIYFFIDEGDENIKYPKMYSDIYREQV